MRISVVSRSDDLARVLVFLEGISKRLGVGFYDYSFVVVAEKLLQAVDIHDVLARHVGNGIRRDG